ncbi:MAG: hypothetical protein AVDCRST_MAG59-4981, partial [uncultured Thermomicrobiales bacterium]
DRSEGDRRAAGVRVGDEELRRPRPGRRIGLPPHGRRIRL